MVIVWRLQTLAAASGLHVDVPNPIQRGDWAVVAKMITDADAVIAIITKQVSGQAKEALGRELSRALELKKRIIPIVEKGIGLQPIQALLIGNDTPIFILDRQSPWLMEAELSQYLKSQKESKDTKQALLALAGTVIGLFLLNNLSKE